MEMLLWALGVFSIWAIYATHLELKFRKFEKLKDSLSSMHRGMGVNSQAILHNQNSLAEVNKLLGEHIRTLDDHAEAIETFDSFPMHQEKKDLGLKRLSLAGSWNNAKDHVDCLQEGDCIRYALEEDRDEDGEFERRRGSFLSSSGMIMGVIEIDHDDRSFSKKEFLISDLIYLSLDELS